MHENSHIGARQSISGRWLFSRDLKEMKELGDVWRSILHRGNGSFKRPEVRVCLVCLRNTRKAVCVGGTELEAR